MTKKTHAPDITERTIIDLSGHTATYYEPNKNKFDFAIGGLPFIMAVTDNTPYKRQTAPFRTERYDTERDPGEHSLAGSGYWIRSQSSWHYGDGIQFTEPLEGNDNEVRFRFRDSVGIDPWTPGQVSLLHRTTQVLSLTDGCGVLSGTDSSGNNVLWALDLSSAPTTSVYKITTSGTTSSFVTRSSLGNEQIMAYATDGKYLAICTQSDLWDVDTSTGTVHAHYHNNKGTISNVIIRYVKSRYIAGVTMSDGTTGLYEINLGTTHTGTATNFSTLTAINGSTTMPKGWIWTDITESRGAIYASGYVGDQSSVFKLTVDSTGALGTIVTTAVMPRGEIVYSLFGYLGTYVMVGTNKGVRVSTVDANYDLTYGPIVHHTKYPVLSFDARDSYVWFGVKNGVDTDETNEGESGTYRLNLAQPLTLAGYASPISTGMYAKASDIYAEGTTGDVPALTIFDNDRVAFAIKGSGIWFESSSGELVPTGYWRTGRIRYSTLENKAFKRLRVRTPDALDGTIDILKVIEDGTDEAFVTISEGTNRNYDYDLASIFPDVSVDASFKFLMSRNSTDNTKGPVIYGVGVKALPTPTRARVIQVPLFCYDKETDKLGMMVGYEGYAHARLSQLEIMEATGKTVMFQDFNADGEPTEVIIEQVAFTRSTPSARNFKGYGGIIMVTARTVA